MDRRAFLSCSGKTCAGLGLGLFLNTWLLESCSSSLSIVKTKQEQGWVAVPLTNFNQSDFAMVRVKDFPFDLGIQKKAENTFLAMVLMCPHGRQPLTKTNSGYFCTQHGSKFSKTGDLLKGPSARGLFDLPYIVEDGLLKIQIEKFEG
ncbi:MAG TPA: Rieske 2Fe-2S domain-containing protein [Edaphocola sp.]|nr:Rieske 2Fe-2S domain-containing protein [Edaphocola sp.]